jgi:hypothetical protein
VLKFPVETHGAPAAAGNALHHRPRDGHGRALCARVYVPGDGERPAPHRGRDEIHVWRQRCLELLAVNFNSSRYKFQSSVGAFEDKTATLTDADTVWTQVRHMHMREAIDKLMADFNKFLEENAVFKGWVSC